MKRLIRLFSMLMVLTGTSSNVMATEGQTILKADRLLDVKSGKILSPGTLVIEDDKIIAVNPEFLPQNATIIDLGDATLLPGLIDVHTHLTKDLLESKDWTHRPVVDTAADNVLRGVKNAKITLKAGFTTVRDLGSIGFADVALMRAIQKGFVEGPDIIPSGHSLSITGGHCDNTGFVPGIAEIGPDEGVSDGRDEILKAVRYQIKHGAKVIKICATAGVLSMEESVGAQQYSSEELRVIVNEAHRHGIKVAAHAIGNEGIMASVNAGVDSIEHGTIFDKKIARAMKKKGTYLVPTVYLIESFDLKILPQSLLPKAEIVGQNAFEGLKLAIDQNVLIAFGTDAGVFPHGDNGKQFATFVKNGMSPIIAIRTATVNAADLLDAKDRGQLASGLRADVIAVPGNPLNNIRAMETVIFVMKAGKIY